MGNTYVYEFLIVFEPPSDFRAKLAQSYLKIKLHPLYILCIVPILTYTSKSCAKSILGKDLRAKKNNNNNIQDYPLTNPIIYVYLGYKKQTINQRNSQ